MIDPKIYSRAVLKYHQSPWQSFQQQLTENPALRWGTAEEAPTVRPVAADAYQEETGDDKGADLLRDHKQHIVLDGGRVKKGRFTDQHLVDAVNELTNHLHSWSGGDYQPHSIDWENAHGNSPADYDDENELAEMDEDDHHKPYPYGTVRVGHYFDDPTNNSSHSIHYSELGGHLADVIGDDINGADWGWNTDNADLPADADGDHTPSLPGTTETNGERFDRLLHSLRTAPYEEPVEEKK